MKKTIITKKQDTGNRLATKITLKIDMKSLPDKYLGIYVCNNGNDTTPIWEDCTSYVESDSSYYFKNKTLNSATGSIIVKIEFNFCNNISFDNNSSADISFDDSFLKLDASKGVMLKSFSQQENFEYDTTLRLWYENTISCPEDSKLAGLDMLYTFTENFSDTNNIFFNINPWTIINYNGSNKLMSKKISDSESTSISFTVDTTHLEIDYLVSSEKNYDCFTVFVDEEQQLKDSGTDMITCKTLSLDLPSGNHTVKLSYSKDSSSSQGNDRVEIWAIRYFKKGYMQTNKFLIIDDGDVKCIPSEISDLSSLNSLTTVGTYPMTDVSLFKSNGMDFNSLKYILINKRSLLSDYIRILLYGDKVILQEEFISLNAMSTMTNYFDFSDSYIKGIEKCTIDGNCDSDSTLKFIFSTDESDTGVAWDGSSWINIDSLSNFLSKGMTLDIVNNLTSDQLLEVSNNKKIRVAMVMSGNNASSNVNVKEIKFDYNLNE